MKLLILYYSRTGNNRVLAHYLSDNIGADIEEITPLRRFKLLGFMLDFFGNRTPKIAPIARRPQDYDHVLFIAPLYDMGIAHPMKTALGALKPNLGAYSFVTLCGYHRDEQSAHVRQELLDLTGKMPAHVQELPVCDLLPAEKQRDVMTVSARKVTTADLDAFGSKLSDIVGWFA